MLGSRFISAMMLSAVLTTGAWAQAAIPEGQLTGPAFSLDANGQRVPAPGPASGAAPAWQNPDHPSPPPGAAPGPPPSGFAPAGGSIPESQLKGPAFSMDANGQRVEAPPPPPPSGGRLDDIATAYIRGLQEALPRHGYRPGAPTGQMDPATRSAILAYQRDAGLRPGVRDVGVLQETMDSVNFAKPPIFAHRPMNPPAPPIAMVPPPPPPSAPPAGLDDGTVRSVQVKLRAMGYDVTVDGQMGQATENAIKAFQASKSLPRTGQIDQPLLDALGR